MTSSDDDNAADEDNTWQSSKSSALDKAAVRLIVIFVLTWKIMHNLSDAAVSALFCFLKRILDLLARLAQCKTLKQVSELLPRSLYMVRKYFGVNRDDFKKFIMPKMLVML